MIVETYIHRSRIAAPAYAVFRWHARPDALEKLTPPWLRVRIVDRTGGIKDGGRVALLVELGPFRRRWVAEHCDYVEGRQFRDIQVQGPFAKWEHMHTVTPDGPDACWLEERVAYALPFGRLGRLFRWLLRSRIRQLFEYRHAVIANEMTHSEPAGVA